MNKLYRYIPKIFTNNDVGAEPRDYKQLIPYVFRNEPHIESFFHNVVNPMFERQYEEKVIGYIGRANTKEDVLSYFIPSFDDLHKHYELLPAVYSKSVKTQLVYLKPYVDLLRDFRFQGNNILDQNKLWVSDIWTWAPPINYNMFANFTTYCWCQQGTPIYQLNTETNIDEIVGQKNATLILDDGSDLVLKSGMRIRCMDDSNADRNNVVYLVENVGSSIILVDDRLNGGNYYSYETFDEFPEIGSNEYDEKYIDETNRLIYRWNSSGLGRYEVIDSTTDTDIRYSVIERGSVEKSRWSTYNRWFDRSLFATSGFGYDVTVATKPIICYTRNIKLFDFSDKNVLDVEVCVGTGGTTLQTLTNTYFVTNVQGRPLKNGSYILFKNESDPVSENKVYQVRVDTTSDFYQLTEIDNTGFAEGDGIHVIRGTFANDVYRYNGVIWQETQKDSIYPKFDLFDTNNVSYSNSITYPQSDFKGSKLFNVAVDKNNIVITDEDDEVSYADYMSNDVITYISNGVEKTYDGVKFYRLMNNDGSYTYQSNMLKQDTKQQQWLVQDFIISYDGQSAFRLEIYPDGDWSTEEGRKAILENINLYINNVAYESDIIEIQKNKTLIVHYYLEKNDVVRFYIANYTVTEEPTTAYYDAPLNLVNNANNEDLPETVKLLDIMPHFYSIIEEQDGLVGNYNSYNNYDSIERKINKGIVIIKQSGSALKTGLLNSMDYTSVRGVIEQVKNDYITFENRFKQQLDLQINKGMIVETTTPKSAVAVILKALNNECDENSPYYNTGVINENSQIPATSSFLRILPIYEPEVVNQDTFVKPKDQLLTHTGAYRDLYGDWRDNIIIELENEIFKSSQSYMTSSDSKYSYLKYKPGFFRDTTYTRDEFNAIAVQFFDMWVNKYGYTNVFDHIYFQDTDPFTWNWSSVKIEGKKLPGNWRGIYDYFYDTFTPHKTPWAMLGFGQMPEWWNITYGTNYSSENTQMWSDIENGIIRCPEGEKQIECLKRPGLSNYIPVGSDNTLLNPQEIFGVTPNELFTADPWQFGDIGPTEYLWKASTDYNFDLANILYLMNPTQWVESTWNTLNNRTVHINEPGEIVIDDEGHIFANHNDLHNYNEKFVFGTSQWFSAILRKNAQDFEDVQQLLSSVEPRLTYLAGTFLRNDSLSFETVSGDVITNQDYDVVKYKSAPIDSSTFSVMIVTYNKGRYTFTGYDGETPCFKIFEPNTLGKFEYFSRSGLTVKKYKEFIEKAVDIPYYTTTGTMQKCYDIIVGYGEYLQSRGWKFRNFDTGLNEPLDWYLMAKSFMTWASKEHRDGEFLILNPFGTNTDEGGLTTDIVYHGDMGYVDNVCQFANGVWAIKDVYNNALTSDNLDIFRQGRMINITTKNNYQVGCSKLWSRTLEHAVVFKNTTAVGVKIYLPLYNLYQSKILMESIRLTMWDGTNYTPGYLLYGSRLVPNADNLATTLQRVYDIDEPIFQTQIGTYVKKLFGYTDIVPLKDLIRNSQVRFFFQQGLLKEKGSLQVLTKLFRHTSLSKEEQHPELFEEWLVKRSDFHNLYNHCIQEIELTEKDFETNPQSIVLTDTRWTSDIFEIPTTVTQINTVISDITDTDYVQLTNIPELAFHPEDKSFSIALKVRTGKNLGKEYALGCKFTGSYRYTPIIVFRNDENITCSIKMSNGQWIELGADENTCIKPQPNTIYYLKIEWTTLEYKLMISLDNEKWFVFSSSSLEDVEIAPIDDRYDPVTNTPRICVGNGYGISGISAWSGEIDLSYFQLIVDNKVLCDGQNGDLSEAQTTLYQTSPTDLVIDKLSDKWVCRNLYGRMLIPYIDYTKNDQDYLPQIPLVRIPDVDYIVENENSINDYIDIPTSAKVWVTFSNENKLGWNLLQLKDVCTIISINYDNEVDISGFDNSYFVTNVAHNLQIGDQIIISSNQETTQLYDGIFTVQWVGSTTEGGANNCFSINLDIQINQDFLAEPVQPTIKDWVSRIYTTLPSYNSQIDDEGDLIVLDRMEIAGRKRYSMYIMKNHGWEQYRVEPDKLDTSLIEHTFIYDNDTQQVLNNVAKFDPYKRQFDSKLPLTYIQDVDPARYNFVKNNETYDLKFWAKSHLGETWWDVSKFKLLDYETDDIQYSKKYWGRAVPFSQIKAYRWIKSNVPPFEYVGDQTILGQAMSLIDETFVYYNYVETKEYNKSLNKVVNVYYFWVEDLYNENIIKNLFNNDYPWCTIACCKNLVINNEIKPQLTILMANITQTLANNTTLQITYNTRNNIAYNDKTDWYLLSESLITDLPEETWVKAKDSICGVDEEGRVVPNPLLPKHLQRGVNFEPRQTMFVDLLGIRKEFISVVNQRLAAEYLQAADMKKIDRLHQVPTFVLDLSKNSDLTLWKQPNEKFIGFIFKVIDGDSVSYKTIVQGNGLQWVDADQNQHYNEEALEFDLNNFQKVANVAEREYYIGSIVYVENDGTGKWAVCEVVDGEWTNLSTQQYDLADYYEYIDWYDPESSYDGNSYPQETFNTVQQFNNAVDFLDYNKLVQVNQGETWYKYIKIEDSTSDSGYSMKLVGYSKGTIKFNDKLFDEKSVDYTEDSYYVMASVFRTILWVVENITVSDI